MNSKTYHVVFSIVGPQYVQVLYIYVYVEKHEVNSRVVYIDTQNSHVANLSAPLIGPFARACREQSVSANNHDQETD